MFPVIADDSIPEDVILMVPDDLMALAAMLSSFDGQYAKEALKKAVEKAVRENRIGVIKNLDVPKSA